jgi:hypothetical protein
MTRKDIMLQAFINNPELFEKYDLPADSSITIFNALNSNSPVLIALAKIVDKYDDENITSLYQQVITLLNDKL